jgi:hypothetical protein
MTVARCLGTVCGSQRAKDVKCAFRARSGVLSEDGDQTGDQPQDASATAAQDPAEGFNSSDNARKVTYKASPRWH